MGIPCKFDPTSPYGKGRAFRHKADGNFDKRFRIGRSNNYK